MPHTRTPARRRGKKEERKKKEARISTIRLLRDSETRSEAVIQDFLMIFFWDAKKQETQGNAQVHSPLSQLRWEPGCYVRHSHVEVPPMYRLSS